MKKLIITILVFFTTATWAIEPEKLSSFKPFTHFGQGEGEAYALSYDTSRRKAEMVDMIRHNKGLRVDCRTLVRQLAEVHGLPFEGCEGAAKVIEADADYQVFACTNEMLASKNLGVTDSAGKRFGTWSRFCIAGEHLLTYKGEPILSTACLNPVVPKEPLRIEITRGLPQSRPIHKPFAGQSGCDLGREGRYLEVAMFTAPAAEHTCAAKHMYAPDGRNRGSDPTGWNPGGKSFSENCGKQFSEGEQGGRLHLSQNPHSIEVVVEDGESETVIFEGKLVGNQLIPSGNGVEIMSADGESS